MAAAGASRTHRTSSGSSWLSKSTRSGSLIVGRDTMVAMSASKRRSKHSDATAFTAVGDGNWNFKAAVR